MNATAATYQVVLKRVEPIRVASMHATVPRVEEFGDIFDRIFGILEDYVARNGKPTGPYMAIYHDPGTEPNALDMHVELAIPFAGTAPDDDEVHVYDLPGSETMACTTHRGLFEEIDGAYDAVREWARENGYRAAGPMRDVYLSCGEGDSPDYVTEVQCPLTT